MPVFYQGEPGSFSEQAARDFFGAKASFHPVRTFRDVFSAVEQGRKAFGVVPIENSVFGSIHQTYDLLLKHPLHIVGETKLRIGLHLMAPKGVTLRSVKAVYSQAQALGQCEDFLRAHPSIRVEAYHDTAAAARMVRELGASDSAAIASAAAAKIHGLHILKRNVESDHRNFTRFLVLSSSPARSTPRPKTSVVFATRNIPGALFKAIAVFALRDINLLKIESRPLIGRPWEYLFYLDIAGDARREPQRSALNHLQEVCTFVRVLGTYPMADR